MRVLLADDDRVLSLLFATRLRALGWTVDVAYDAMQAVMFAMRSSPDVIVLDIQMPGGTGVEALRKLMASTKTSQIPVVIMTGSIDPQEAPRLHELGAREFLVKPVEVEALHQTLTRITTGA